MKRLLNEHEFTPQWFEKFVIYADNIKGYGGIVMEYKSVESKKTFENLMKFGIVVNCIVSLLFIVEILIVEL